MRFDHPEYFILLVCVALALLLVVRAFRTKRKTLEAVGTPSLLLRLVVGVSPVRQRLKAGLFLSGLLLVVIALAGPQWGLRRELLRMAGRDIIVAVDTSESMYARDVEPDRLGRAKIELSSLLGSMTGDRVGLVAFKGDGLPLVPLTTDYDAVREFLAALATDLIPQPGTNIGRAIEMSLHLLPGQGTSKAIILLTDGEDTFDVARSAAAEAASQGVKIFPVGIGSGKGEPIPLRDGGFKKDRAGKIVLSRLDEKLLRDIADTSGGTFVRSRAGEIGVARAYTEIQRMETREWEKRVQTHLQDRFRYPLSLALLLLLGELVLSERRE